MTARALLLSTDDESLDGYDRALRDAGYDVLRCQSAGRPAFPCVGLSGGGCPLDAAGGVVDVALDVRQHPWPHPTLRETGVTCALRSGVPVVVVSDHPHPFERVGAFGVSTDTDVAEACEDAIADALEEVRAEIADEVGIVLGRHGCDVPFAVAVERGGGRLQVRIVATAPKEVGAMAAARAAVVARRFDARSTSLVVDVVDAVSGG